MRFYAWNSGWITVRRCDVGAAPIAVCLSPRVSVRFTDSSVLVAEVALDTVDDMLVRVDDPCKKPLQRIARDWRFLEQDQAVAVFRSVLDGLQRSRKREFDMCILDSRPSPARRAEVYVVVDDSLFRRIIVLSKDEQTIPSRNSFVQVAVVSRDSANSGIALMGQQRLAPCRDALRSAESSAH